jgi:hypothetical protein
MGAVRLQERAVQDSLARASALRDTLLERLEQRPSTGLFGRLRQAWERRRDRRRLQEVVAELQSDQTRLLVLRARLRALEQAPAERDWQHLQALVADAAAAWKQGRAENLDLHEAVAVALDRGAGQGPAVTFDRYRSLVGRLARVNEAIRRQSAPPASDSTNAPRTPGAAVDDAARPAAAPGQETSGFLGIAERGLPVTTETDLSLEAWKRLRATLADEIVATATAITRRVRGSS